MKNTNGSCVEIELKLEIGWRAVDGWRGVILSTVILCCVKKKRHVEHDFFIIGLYGDIRLVASCLDYNLFLVRNSKGPAEFTRNKMNNSWTPLGPDFRYQLCAPLPGGGKKQTCFNQKETFFPPPPHKRELFKTAHLGKVRCPAALLRIAFGGSCRKHKHHSLCCHFWFH